MPCAHAGLAFVLRKYNPKSSAGSAGSCEVGRGYSCSPLKAPGQHYGVLLIDDTILHSNKMQRIQAIWPLHDSSSCGTTASAWI